jgi:hypothetical protein
MPTNKKKKSAKKVGKKKAAPPPSQAATTCAQCARPVKPAAAIECVCTTVIFCSPACQALALTSSHASCPGPPNDDVIDIRQKMREKETGWSLGSDGQTFVHRDAEFQQRWKEEHCRDIQKPVIAVLLQHGLSG